MEQRYRLAILLLILAATIGLALTRDPGPTNLAPVRPGRPKVAIFLRPVPVVKKLPDSVSDDQQPHPWHRNPFQYADGSVTEAPPEPPPPPPPPPPEIKPESRFLGTLYEDKLVALFSLKSEITPLREGEMLENKYLVKRIEPDAVTLEDASFHNTAVIALGGKR